MSDRDPMFEAFWITATRLNDLRAVVEYADQRTTTAAEADDVVEAVTLSAADWNRVVAVARFNKSDAAQRVINEVCLPDAVDRAAMADAMTAPAASAGSTSEDLRVALSRGAIPAMRFAANRLRILGDTETAANLEADANAMVAALRGEGAARAEP